MTTFAEPDAPSVTGHPVHVSPCGCTWRFYRWGGWTQEGACADHPIEPEPNDRPTPEERQMYREWGSRNACLP